jgi:hypothetical protein
MTGTRQPQTQKLKFALLPPGQNMKYLRIHPNRKAAGFQPKSARQPAAGARELFEFVCLETVFELE